MKAQYRNTPRCLVPGSWRHQLVKYPPCRAQRPARSGLHGRSARRPPQRGAGRQSADYLRYHYYRCSTDKYVSLKYEVFAPRAGAASAAEAALVEGVAVIAVSHLSQAVGFLNDQHQIALTQVDLNEVFALSGK